MDIILIRDHEKIGKEGEIKKVSDGYARNFLIPRGYALPSTDANLKQLKSRKKMAAKKNEKEKQKAIEVKKKLEDRSFSIKVKCGENGKLYGAVTNKKISEALQELNGIAIDRKKIVLKEPIKNTGKYNIEIKLFDDVSANMTLQVEEA